MNEDNLALQWCFTEKKNTDYIIFCSRGEFVLKVKRIKTGVMFCQN